MLQIGLVARYAVFAAASASINLAIQWLSFHLYRGPGEYIVGVFAGTATGLLSKYALDKFWIFGDRSVSVIENTYRLGYYTLTGVVTTTIFWGTETAFALIGNQAMRYVGAILGLSIGYGLKFHLDRRYVFRAKS